MKCPKVVINLFAENLRTKAVEIEEYIDENLSPLNPRQLKRLEIMNESLRSRCRRMRRAWREHDPTVDSEDADCLDELNNLVKSMKNEVAETLEKSYAILQSHGITQNPTTIEQGQKRREEEYPNGEQSTIRENGEKIARQNHNNAKPTWTRETSPTPQYAASKKMEENYDGPANERWRALEKNNNALNSGIEEQKRIRQKRCPAEEKRESSNSKREITGHSTSDDSEAKKPEKKKARKAAVDATLEELVNATLAEMTKMNYERMADKYEECTKTFEEWSEKTGHGLDKREASDLQSKITGLLKERNSMWNESKKALRKETNYGLMKLRHSMAQKNLSDMLSWFEHTEDRKGTTRDKIDGEQVSQSELAKNMRGGRGATKTSLQSQPIMTEAHKQNIEHETAANTKDEAECPECGDVFSSGKMLTLHTCETESDESETSITESENSATSSSNNDESRVTEENDQWRAHLNANGTGMISENVALVDHKKETIELPNGINQLYTTRSEQGNVFHIALPTTGLDQYWCMVRADTERQTIDYKGSRLTLRVDKLREIVRSARGRSNAVYTPIPSQNQSERFGIYVSPKMTTHAFVGPFKTTSTNNGGETKAAPGIAFPKIHQAGLPRKILTNWPACLHIPTEAPPPPPDTCETNSFEDRSAEQSRRDHALVQKAPPEGERCCKVATRSPAPAGLANEEDLQQTLDYGSDLQTLINEFTERPPTLLEATALWQTAPPREHVLSQTPPTGGAPHEEGTDNWPPQQHYVSKNVTRNNTSPGDAAAGRRTIDRQRPGPNRPPELETDRRIDGEARHRPALGEARLQ